MTLRQDNFHLLFPVKDRIDRPNKFWAVNTELALTLFFPLPKQYTTEVPVTSHVASEVQFADGFLDQNGVSRYQGEREWTVEITK